MPPLGRDPNSPYYFASGYKPTTTKKKKGNYTTDYMAGGGAGVYAPPKGVMDADESNPSWGSANGSDFLVDFPSLGGPQGWEYSNEDYIKNFNDQVGGEEQQDYLNIDAYMPDYSNLIDTDPEYLAALTEENETNAMQQAMTAEQIKSLAVGFGGDLSGLLSQGLIDQATVDKAKANEFSTMKELGRGLERGTTQGDYDLAARGILSSGALPALRGALNEDYQRQTTAATNDLLGRVTGAKNQLAQGIAQRRGMRNQARASVANRLAQQAMSQSRAATRAKWNPKLGAYEAPDGRLYDRNKNLIQGY